MFPILLIILIILFLYNNIQRNTRKTNEKNRRKAAMDEILKTADIPDYAQLLKPTT
ncbi:hypothetical protein HZS_4964 [Henneguya salminicola]|nr:hypothetical protein HZS_4964 [Henneguya salminicola]